MKNENGMERHFLVNYFKVNYVSPPTFKCFLFLLVQLYISEMSHERVRGTLGSCVQLMVVLGIMGVYLAGTYAQL